jgi:hypothetical protein
MKVHLLFSEKDFDFGAGSIPSEESLVQDLELDRIFAAMSRGDTFLEQVVRQVVLHGLSATTAIR